MHQHAKLSIYYISDKGPISCVHVVVLFKEGSPLSSIFNICSLPPTHTLAFPLPEKLLQKPRQSWSPAMTETSAITGCPLWHHKEIIFRTVLALAHTKEVKVLVEKRTFVHNMGHFNRTEDAKCFAKRINPVCIIPRGSFGIRRWGSWTWMSTGPRVTLKQPAQSPGLPWQLFSKTQTPRNPLLCHTNWYEFRCAHSVCFLLPSSFHWIERQN